MGSPEEARLELHQQAAWVVANTQPRRHLLWEPEQFQVKPVERLVKTGFPLREVSLPDTPGQSLRHLSVSVLQGLLQPKVKRSAKFAGNSDGKAAKDHADSDFHDWLFGMGALEIKDQSGHWFDREWWFDVERFYQYVSTQKGYRVDSLQSPATRSEWGERLRQVLFQENANGSCDFSIPVRKLNWCVALLRLRAPSTAALRSRRPASPSTRLAPRLLRRRRGPSGHPRQPDLPARRRALPTAH